MKRVVLGLTILSVTACLAVSIAVGNRRPVSLQQGLQQLRATVDATVSIAAAGLDSGEGLSTSADPRLASQLSNNHSTTDESSADFPGYNDCDSWENILFDGWNAFYSATIALRSEADAPMLIAKTKSLWESRGLVVTASSFERMGEINVKTLSASDAMGNTYEMNVDASSLQADLTGSTPCLPPE